MHVNVYTTFEVISLGVRDFRKKKVESFVVVKMGKISILRSLKNKLVNLFFNSWEIEPINGIFIIWLNSMSFLWPATNTVPSLCRLSNELRTFSKMSGYNHFFGTYISILSPLHQIASVWNKSILLCSTILEWCLVYKLLGTKTLKFNNTSVVVLFQKTQASHSSPLIQIRVSKKDKTLFSLSSIINLIIACWLFMLSRID